jgi:hypothetical protein
LTTDPRVRLPSSAYHCFHEVSGRGCGREDEEED